jgi:acetolactate synthase-1/2/3 large subunit
MPTAAATTVSLLASAGVQRFYTVPGESFLEVLDENDERLRLVSMRHESGAAFIAYRSAARCTSGGSVSTPSEPRRSA